MAKKSRRARRKARTVAVPVRISKPRQPLAAEALSEEVDFAGEYYYVIEDLKRIGITALGLLILLIAAALLIT